MTEAAKRSIIARAQLNTIRAAYSRKWTTLSVAEVATLAAVRKQLDEGEFLTAEQEQLMKTICGKMGRGTR